MWLCGRHVISLRLLNKEVVKHMNKNWCKIANVLLCDVAHRLRQGVLYFKSAIRLHSTCINVILFVLVRTVWPSLRRFFTESTNYQLHLYYMELHSNQRINVGSMYINLCTPISKIMAAKVPIFTKLAIN